MVLKSLCSSGRMESKRVIVFLLVVNPWVTGCGDGLSWGRRRFALRSSRSPPEHRIPALEGNKDHLVRSPKVAGDEIRCGAGSRIDLVHHVRTCVVVHAGVEGAKIRSPIAAFCVVEAGHVEQAGAVCGYKA